MTGEPTVLVSQPSATGGSRQWEDGINDMHAISRNHSDMVKFYPRDPCYNQVKYVLADILKEIHSARCIKEGAHGNGEAEPVQSSTSES